MNTKLSVIDILDKKVQLAFFVLIAVMLSWLGVFDGMAEAYIDSALLQSGAAFAVAKSLNGMISILQSSTVELGIGVGFSMSIGEALDPINDLVEEYSSLMKLSIGSLVIQKLLVEIVSDGLFKVLLTISGLLFILSFWVQQGRYINVFLKTFVFILFIRFLVVLIVLLNGLVDRSFMEDKVNNEITKLEQVSDDVKAETDKQTHPSGLSAEKVSVLQTSLTQIEKKIAQVQSEILATEKELNLNNRQLEAHNQELKTQNEKLGIDRFNLFKEDNQEIARLKTNIERLETRISRLEEKLEDQRESLDESLEQKQRVQNTLAGEANSITESVSKRVSKLSESVSQMSSNVDIARISKKLESSAQNMISVMSIFIFKTLILPLLFLYLLIKASNKIWGVDLKEILQVEAKKIMAELNEVSKPKTGD